MSIKREVARARACMCVNNYIYRNDEDETQMDGKPSM